MENLTPAEWGALVLGIASALVLLTNAGKSIADIVRAVKAPNDLQNDRLDKVEKRLDAVEGKLDNDNVRFEAMAEDNRITQRALLALLDHGIDGNNIKQMQDAKEDLYTHLTERK